MYTRTKSATLLLIISTLFSINYSMAQTTKMKLENMKPKILFVVTSHDTKGNTGEKTGYYLGLIIFDHKTIRYSA